MPDFLFEQLPALWRSAGFKALAMSLLAAASCSPPEYIESEPHAQAELLGRRARAPEPWFDSHKRPIIRVGFTADWHIEWSTGDGDLPLPYEERRVPGGWLLETGGSTPPIGPGVIVLRLGAEEVARWAGRWTVSPDASPGLSEARAYREAGDFDAAHAALDGLRDPDELLWAPVERARLFTAEEDLERARQAWIEGAALAERRGVESEVSRRLGAAAFVAKRQRRIGAMAAHLRDAAAANGGDPMSIAMTAHMQGILAREMADWRAAEAHFARAAAAARRADMPQQLHRIDESRATLLSALGLHGEALELIARLDRPGLPESVAGRLALNTGWLLLRAMIAGAIAPDFDAVEVWFDAAEIRSREPDTAVNLYVNRAWRALMARDLPDARWWLGRARDVIDRARRKGPGAASFAPPDLPLVEGKVAIAEGDWRAAEQHFSRLDARARVELGEDGGDLGWRADLGRARAARGAGDLRVARAFLDRALARLDRVGVEASLRRSRVPFFADRAALVDEAVEAALEAGEPASAFVIADRARARLFRGLQRMQVINRLDAPARLALAALREQAEETRRRLAALWAEEPWVAGSAKRSWARDLREAQALRRDAFDALAEFVERRVADPMPTDFDPVATVRPGEAILSVAGVRGGRVALWAAPSGVVARPLAPSIDALPQPPPGTRHVFVVASGHPDVQRAAARHDGAETVSFLPMAAWLAKPQGRPGHTPLIVADPIGDLPHARSAGRALAQQWAGATLLVGDSATKDAVRQALGDASRVHLSGHGRLEVAHPWEAHLVLADGTRLDAFDVMAVRVPGSLVVLSACRVGADDVLARDDLLGLPEAFLAAGAAAVVAADRTVKDKEAGRFTTLFYAKGGADEPAAALRAAVRELREAPDDNPNWDAWRLVGRPTLDNPNR